jgi:DNA-binding helix-hairpin-helix protein with protein kinase domain
MKAQAEDPKPKPMLKTCSMDPRHIWMADIPYCPYCAYSPEQRAEWARRTNWGSKVIKKEKA